MALSAASQSKGLLTVLALHGVRTDGLSTAGLGGTRRLGKVVGPVAGAESGYTPAGDSAAACLMEMGAGLEYLGGMFSFVQLHSDVVLMLLAEVGALSRSSSVVLSRDSSDLVVSTLFVLAPVAVRFRAALTCSGAVRGGLAMAGEAGLMALRKSMYASGGVIGVFSGLSSKQGFADSMLGVGGCSSGADGRPAEGRLDEYRPADGRGPLNDSAESGVRTDEADKRASPGKVSGKAAVVGVLRAGSFGRVAVMVARWRGELDVRCERVFWFDQAGLRDGLDRRVCVCVCVTCAGL